MTANTTTGTGHGPGCRTGACATSAWRGVRPDARDGYHRHQQRPETLGEFQSFELARGVPVHDLAQRLIRLAREAG